MNIIYFTMKKLNENRAFLAMLGFLLVFSCSKDKKEGNGDATKYTLSITKPTNGKLVSKPGNIDCGGEGNDCKAEFSKGTEVTLTATADTGYILGAWQGACDKTKADQPCKLSMNANKTAGKAFLKPTLTITKPTNGKLVSKPGNIDCGSEGDDVKYIIFIFYLLCEAEFSKGTEVTLTATADTGYILGAWQGDCSETGIEETCQLSMDANKTAGRAFLARPTLSIDPKPTGGTLTSNAGGISCGSEGNDCKAEFEKDTEVTLTATADTGYILGAWQGACDKTKATESTCKLNMDANKTVGLTFTNDIDGDSVLNVDDVDDDNDGLIEIHDLDMFNHIQYSLAGTSYKTGADATDNREGAPEEATDDCTTIVTDTVFYLCGYELARDLDFAEGASYAAGSTKKNDWQPNESDISMATNEGFVGPNNFAGIFEGNGHSISNLYSRGGGAHVGLFRSTTSRASIRNLGVVDANLYGSAVDQNLGALAGYNRGNITASSVTGGTVNGGDGADRAGGLVGRSDDGNIVASHATGAVNGGVGSDNVGGLVGYMLSGTNTITASYATGAVNGGDGADHVGGLVGLMDSSGTNTITASYATGAVNGGVGNDYVGGLVGYTSRGTNTVTASYATGVVNGGVGNDSVGGLVGYTSRDTNTITASYATGDANGGVGVDRVGGLVGQMSGTNSITASYATGNANGGMGNDSVGGLVGYTSRDTNTITASYATGDANGGVGSDSVSGLVGFMGAGTNSITASYATGAANGNGGSDNVGGLVGEVDASGTHTITHSYAFGATNGGTTDGNDGTAHPAGLSGSGAAKANGLTAPGGSENTDADAVWDQVASNTKDAWDFGTNTQAPALKYADYDGDMAGVDYCALFPDKIPGTDTDLVCGTANASLLPGQGR